MGEITRPHFFNITKKREKKPGKKKKGQYVKKKVLAASSLGNCRRLKIGCVKMPTISKQNKGVNKTRSGGREMQKGFYGDKKG